MKLKDLSFLFGCLILLFMSGCFGCNQQDEVDVEESTSSVESNSNANSESDNPANLDDALAQVKNAVQELNNGEEVEVVDFRDLKKRMPEKLLGLDRVEHEGQKAGAMGVTTSMAEATYRKGDKEIKMTIIDVGGVSFALNALAAWSVLEMDRETEDEVERTFTKDGSKYFEKYNFKTNRGETSVIHNNRFIGTVAVKNMSRKDMEKALNRAGFNELEELQ